MGCSACSDLKTVKRSVSPYMPAAKISSDVPDAMKPEHKEGQDSLDTFIRQAIGKEPFLSFSRAGESPVQWIQLLHALDQQGTNKLSKGPKLDGSVEGRERTSLELYNGMTSFSSELNGFKEPVPAIKSGGGLPLKGSKSTSDHMQSLKIPEAVVAFAQAAAKANGEPEKYLPGWPLLSPPKVQLQKCDKCSKEFCSPINYRRHIRVHRRSLNIDKDTRKNRDYLSAFWDKLSLDEAKELVSFKNVTLEEVTGPTIIRALSSFVRKPGFSSLPQTYVKAGAALLDIIQTKPSRLPISSQELFGLLDDASEKTFMCAGTAVSLQRFVFDGEAGKIALEMKNLIACTSFLVEQKLVQAWVADKDAEALRCQKLLVEEEEAAQKRQAELLERKRLKKLRQKEQKAKEQIIEAPRVNSVSETSSPEASSSLVEMFVGPMKSDVDLNTDACAGSVENDLDNPCGNSGRHMGSLDQAQGIGRRHLGVARRALKPSRTASNGYHSGPTLVSKPSTSQKRPASSSNSHKVWTRKTKTESEGENSSLSVQHTVREQLDQNDKCEVLIGSISVAIKDGNANEHHPQRLPNTQEKHAKVDGIPNGGVRSVGKFWRPVGRQEVGVSNTAPSNKKGVEGVVLAKISAMGSDGVGHMGPRLFSSRAAEAFLAQRWKEAIAAEHMKLVLPPETECSDCQDGASTVVDVQRPTSPGGLGNPSGINQLVTVRQVQTVGGGVGGSNKPKFRAKGEKGCRLKYIPKQRNNV
ncbi:hypothetical protein H6P81_017150 [Aristolochia fimbriata]|uniref:C2H2-type domain-containing protein n=1 Tax=Aristolochia fimbriata TaxID=158543 RepID=A0AAV7E0B5_ARIFI|nr:hypothetical protein H6P81_017150 [Aristolochia fimbriata]